MMTVFLWRILTEKFQCDSEDLFLINCVSCLHDVFKTSKIIMFLGNEIVFIPKKQTEILDKIFIDSV
jgi:hypothetical protein